MDALSRVFYGLIVFVAIQSHASVLTQVGDIKELSPFDPLIQKQVLHHVLEEMVFEKNESIEVPEIRVTESVLPQEKHIFAAAESQGMPAWALAKGINMYLFDHNIILLGSDMKVHNLAHEFAHYVQMHYKKIDRREFAQDYIEMEAVDVQRNFR